MAYKPDFNVINELKTHATYLEGIAITPINAQFARNLERAARVMRKAARVIETQGDDFIPEFLRAGAR